LKDWNLKREVASLDQNRIRHTLILTDPVTRLTVRCEGIEYLDFPVIEWALYFKNNSDVDTPIIKDIRAIDIKIDGSGSFLLHHNVGFSS
jgi:alpha-galactosidase